MDWWQFHENLIHEFRPEGEIDIARCLHIHKSEEVTRENFVFEIRIEFRINW
jgi:hypothetical protein